MNGPMIAVIIAVVLLVIGVAAVGFGGLFGNKQVGGLNPSVFSTPNSVNNTSISSFNVNPMKTKQNFPPVPIDAVTTVRQEAISEQKPVNSDPVNTATGAARKLRKRRRARKTRRGHFVGTA